MLIRGRNIGAYTKQIPDLSCSPSGRISHRTETDLMFLVCLQGGVRHAHSGTLAPPSVVLPPPRAVDALLGCLADRWGKREDYTWKVLMGQA